MSRSRWKGPFIGTKSEKALKELKTSSMRKLVSRDATILPKFIEQTLKVHNGRKLVDVLVTEEMIGHKFGEFSSTRKRFSFKQTKTKK